MLLGAILAAKEVVMKNARWIKLGRGKVNIHAPGKAPPIFRSGDVLYHAPYGHTFLIRRVTRESIFVTPLEKNLVEGPFLVLSRAVGGA